MDWKPVISELMALGYTQTAIARHCGCKQATVSDLARGINDNPRYSYGQRLLDLLARARREAKKQKAAAA